jgi:hypothetical protein
MITKEQAMTESNFFIYDNGKCRHWRRNGQTKTWKTRPDEFKVPVKYGLYAYGYVTQDNAHLFFLTTD